MSMYECFLWNDRIISSCTLTFFACATRWGKEDACSHMAHFTRRPALSHVCAFTCKNKVMTQNNNFIIIYHSWALSTMSLSRIILLFAEQSLQFGGIRSFFLNLACTITPKIIFEWYFWHHVRYLEACVHHLYRGPKFSKVKQRAKIALEKWKLHFFSFLFREMLKFYEIESRIASLLTLHF